MKELLVLEKIKTILPIITVILFATTLVSSTMAGMQTARVNEIRTEIKEIRTDMKIQDREIEALSMRVTILETSLKDDTSAIREIVNKLANVGVVK